MLCDGIGLDQNKSLFFSNKPIKTSNTRGFNYLKNLYKLFTIRHINRIEIGLF